MLASTITATSSFDIDQDLFVFERGFVITRGGARR
jgi:hypothetical protein